MNVPYFNPAIPPIILIMRLRQKRERKTYGGRTHFQVQTGYPPCTANKCPPHRAPPVPKKAHTKIPHIFSAQTLVRKSYTVSRLPRDV